MVLREMTQKDRWRIREFHAKLRFAAHPPLYIFNYIYREGYVG